MGRSAPSPFRSPHRRIDVTTSPGQGHEDVAYGFRTTIEVIESQKKYSALVVPYRLSYWPNYNFIAEHYYKDKIWLK